MNTPLHARRRGPFGWALLLFALLLSGRAGQAQTVDTYGFAPSAGTFAPLSATTATAVTTISSDDAVTGAIPLGFSFVYDGNTYTQVYANSNGFLSFNASTPGSGSYTNALATSAATYRPLAAPYWDDLTGTGGTASYQTTGTAGSRVFTFEWLNWRRLSAAGAQLSFQVQLVEGSNVVRFVYRQEATAMSGASVSIGLSGVGTGSGSFLSLNSAGTSPTASSTVETTTISTVPATGQIYTFTPPAPAACPAPRNLAATVTNTTAVLTYTVTNTTAGPFTILYGPTGFNPTLPSSGTNVYSTTTATGTTASLTGLTPQTGYQFYVTQNCGGTAGNSVMSNAGSFTTNPNPAANDNCAQAVAITVAASACASPVSGTVFGGTQSLPPTSSCSGTTANDVWYSFVANGTSQTITFAPQFAGVYDVRSGTCAASTSIYCNAVAAGATNASTIGGLISGQTYFVRVYTSSTTQPAAAASTFVLCIATGPVTPANDDCAGAINVPIQFGACVAQTSADNTAATNTTGVSAPTCANYQGKDIWFKVTVPVSGTVTVRTLAPTAGSTITDTGLSVYSGTCGSLTDIGCNDDFAGIGNYSQLTFTGRTAGEVLYIRVWAYSGSNSGLIAVCATSPSNCAVPTTPSATNITNTTAQLTWVAPSGGSAGNTYEIEYGLQGFSQGTGTSVTGITGTTFALTGLTPTTTYCYYVRQNCGAANGSSAFVGPACFTTPLTAPANDEPCGAIALGASATTGTNVGATTSTQNGINVPACAPAAVPKDVWYSFVATATTRTISITGTAAGSVRIYTSPSCSAGPFTQVFCQAAPGSNQNVGPISLTGLTVGTRYYMAVSGYGSSDTPGTFVIAGTPSATRAQADTDALLVFPNPSNTGQLTLRLNGLTGFGQATLLNALGQTVRTQALNGAAEQTLSTRELAAGLYTLRVTVGEQVLTRKVVLE